MSTMLAPRSDGVLPLTCLFLLLSASFQVQPEDGDVQPLAVIAAAHTAHWYDTGRDGEGWSLEILGGGHALAYWFTYDELGEPRWLMGTGEIIDDRIEFPELLVTRGGRFGADFDPEDVEREVVGSAVMQFEDCDSGWVAFDAFGQQLTMALERLSITMGLDCDPPAGAGAPAPAYQSGSWYDPAHDGEGFTLQWLNTGMALVTWFSYNADGQQYWMQGMGEPDGDALRFDELYATHGPVFGDGFDPDDLELIPWGALTLTLDCDTGIAEYDSLLPEFGQGSFNLTRLTLPYGLQCPPSQPSEPDFSNAAWTVIGNDAPALSELPAAALGEYIYIGGGLSSLSTSVREFWRYHPGSGQWSRLADLPERRDHGMMAALDGYVFYFGGYGNVLSGATSTTWRYDPGADAWTVRAPMPGNRAAGGAAALDGHIYVAGGAGTNQTVFRYTPATDRWQSMSIDDPWNRDHCAVVAYRDEIWLLGGRGIPSGGNAGVTIFDPANGSSRPGPSMRLPRGGFPAGVIHDHVVVAGGELFQPPRVLSEVEVYRPGEGWQTIASLPVAIHGAGGAVYAGRFHVLGGSVVANDIVSTTAIQRLDVPYADSH